RALSHGCLGYAEVRSSYSIRRHKSVHQHLKLQTNDFAFKLANVNGTGSASANGLLMQAIFRMGIPVSGKNLFPSNIQGLPTWYEIRVNAEGHTARTSTYDLMVAMNAESNARAIELGRKYAREHFECPLTARLKKMDATKESILIDGNSATALGCVYAGATVAAWYPITPSTSVMDAFTGFCAKFRTDKA